MAIDDYAMDKAECTLLIEEISYRDANGAMQKGFKIHPWGKLKYGSAGEEQSYTVPVHVSFGGILDGTDNQTKIYKFENHSGVVADDGSSGGMHFLSPL